MRSSFFEIFFEGVFFVVDEYVGGGDVICVIVWHTLIFWVCC